jgi:hypothetical protein
LEQKQDAADRNPPVYKIRFDLAEVPPAALFASTVSSWERLRGA